LSRKLYKNSEKATNPRLLVVNTPRKFIENEKEKREIPFSEGIFFSGLASASCLIRYWAGRKEGSPDSKPLPCPPESKPLPWPPVHLPPHT
jgi:hypothetical protein